MYPFTRDIHYSIQKSASHCFSLFIHCDIASHVYIEQNFSIQIAIYIVIWIVLPSVNWVRNIIIFTPEERPPLLKSHISGAKGIASQKGFQCIYSLCSISILAFILFLLFIFQVTLTVNKQSNHLVSDIRRVHMELIERYIGYTRLYGYSGVSLSEHSACF